MSYLLFQQFHSMCRKPIGHALPKVHIVRVAQEQSGNVRWRLRVAHPVVVPRHHRTTARSDHGHLQLMCDRHKAIRCELLHNDDIEPLAHLQHFLDCRRVEGVLARLDAPFVKHEEFQKVANVLVAIGEPLKYIKPKVMLKCYN